MPSFRAVASAAGADGATCALTIPASTQAGDLLLAHVVNSAQAAVITAPGGWTLVPNCDRVAARDDDVRGWVYYKIAVLADAGATATWTFTSGGSSSGGAILAYSGVDQTNPINTSNSNANNSAAQTAITTPSITTTVSGCQIVCFFCTDQGAATGWSAGSMTERYDVSHGLTFLNHAGYDEAQAAAGAVSKTGTHSISSGNGYAAFIIAVAPSGAGGGGGGGGGGGASQSVTNFDVQTLTGHARPPANWRPFADSSPFNQPAVGAPLYNDGTRTSASIINYLATTRPNIANRALNEGGTNNDWGHPLYFAKSTDALVTVRNRRATVNGGDYGTAETEGQTYRVPLAAQEGGNLQADADSHMTVVQPGGAVLTMWEVEPPVVNGGNLWCGFSAVESSITTGDGVTRSDQGGATAAHFVAGAGDIRWEELANGFIGHALFAVSYRTRGFVTPAVAGGSETADTHAPLMGSRLRYNKDEAYIAAQAWPAWLKTIARCLRDYGVYIGDTGGGSSDALELFMEDDLVYRSFPEFSSPYPNEEWAADQGIPSHLSGSRTIYDLKFLDYASTFRIQDFQVVQYVQATVPINSAAPVIADTTPVVGETLTVTTGTWANNPTSYAYQWQRSTTSGSTGFSDIAGATTNSYTLVTNDTGAWFRCRVIATNASGAGAAAFSNSVGPTAATVPSNTTAPAITGTATVGQTLACSQGAWANNPTAYAYQWQRADAVGGPFTSIAGATASTYVLTTADATKYIRCTVTATNSAGSSPATSSNIVGPVASLSAPGNTAAPVASVVGGGTLQQGATLTTTNGTWSGSPTSFAYDWQRADNLAFTTNVVAISGATAATYALTSADVGKYVRARVTATNGSGSSSPAASNILGPVAGLVPSIVSDPTVSGSPNVGVALSVSTGTWANSPSSFAYQWQRALPISGLPPPVGDGSWANIAGQTTNGYTVAAGDVGYYIRARVTATNSSGSTIAYGGPVGPAEAAPAAPSANLPVIIDEFALDSSPLASNPVWTALTLDGSRRRLRSFVIDRGRTDEFDDFKAGRSSDVYSNRDRALDRTNTSGPYTTKLKPRRRHRKRAVWAGVTYPLYDGHVKRWPQEWESRDGRCPLPITDAFEIFQNGTVSTPLDAEGVRTVRAAERSDLRLHWILDQFGWASTRRLIDVGAVTIQAYAYEGTNVLDAMRRVEEAEGGSLFMDASGNIVFEHKYKRIESYSTSQATFGDGIGELDYQESDPDDDVEHIYNQVTGKRANDQDARAFESIDQASIDQNGRTAKTVELWSADDVEVEVRSQYYAIAYANPLFRVKSISFYPQKDPANLWPQALGRKFGERITVKARYYGIGSVQTVECRIEGIQHEYKDRIWKTTFRLSAIPLVELTDYWQLGEAGSSLGGNTVLAF